MPISRRALADDEEVLVDLRLHWVFLSGPVLLTAIAVAAAITIAVEFPAAPVAVAGVLAVMVAVPALWLTGRVVRWLGISLVVTSARLIYRRGVLGRDLVQLRLQRVTEVHCVQSVLERLIGSGRLVVELAGEPPTVVDDVRRPRALQRVITRQLDEAAHGAPGFGPCAGAVHGAGVPSSPISVPRPLLLEDTPPHGLLDAERTPVVGISTVVAGHGGTVAGTVPGSSIPEQLIQLDDLRRRGIVSEEEDFAAKKAELLSRL